MFIEIFALVASITIAVISLRQFGIVPIPTILALQLAFSQLMFILVSYGIIEYRFHVSYARGGIDDFGIQVVIGYTIAALIAYLSAMIGMKIRQRGRPSASVIYTIDQRVKIPVVLIAGYLIATILVASILIPTLNWPLVWQNDTYLLMTSPGAILGYNNAITVMALRAMPFLSVASAVIFSFSLLSNPRHVIVILVSGITFGFGVVYYIGAHSRVAVMIIAVWFFSLVMAGYRRPATLLLIGAMLTSAVSSMALSGRIIPDHGISSIGRGISLLAEEWVSSQVLLNFAEGIFVTAESMVGDVEYSSSYKLLSILPSVSAIDGFDEVWITDENRLTTYVPRSGVSEIFAFGSAFSLIVIAIYVGAIVLSYAMAFKSRVGWVGQNALMFLGFYIVQTYSVRTSFRFVWLGILTALVIAAAERWIKAKAALSDAGPPNVGVKRSAKVTSRFS